MELVVTLVHGTILLGMGPPTWHKTEGDFAKRLIAACEERATVTVYSFDWDGKNSNKARVDAAERLAGDLASRVRSMTPQRSTSS